MRKYALVVPFVFALFAFAAFGDDGQKYEIGVKGITANMVSPGFVETSMLDQLPQERRDDAIKLVPLRRFGRP